jgi:hypothetical protein
VTRLCTSAKNRFLADLDALLEPPRDLFFPMRTADPMDTDSENMSLDDQRMDTARATATQRYPEASRMIEPSQESPCNGSIPLERFHTKVDQEDPVSTQRSNKVRQIPST